MKLTEEEAIRLYDSNWWKVATPEQIVGFQLFEERLCMNFGDFQVAVGDVLGRGVWTHEFAHFETLIKELGDDVPRLTFEDVLKLVPIEVKS